MTIATGDQAWIRFTRVEPTPEAAERIRAVLALPEAEREQFADEPVQLVATEGWAPACVHEVRDHCRVVLVVKDPYRDAEQLVEAVTRDHRGCRNPNLWFGAAAPAEKAA